MTNGASDVATAKNWDGIISFPLVKEGPVYAILNEIRKETFSESNQLLI